MGNHNPKTLYLVTRLACALVILITNWPPLLSADTGQILLRSGMSAPGTSSETFRNFSLAPFDDSRHQELIQGSGGQLGFYADLQNAQGTFTRKGYFRRDTNGLVSLIAATGQPTELGPTYPVSALDGLTVFPSGEMQARILVNPFIPGQIPGSPYSAINFCSRLDNGAWRTSALATPSTALPLIPVGTSYTQWQVGEGMPRTRCGLSILAEYDSGTSPNLVNNWRVYRLDGGLTPTLISSNSGLLPGIPAGATTFPFGDRVGNGRYVVANSVQEPGTSLYLTRMWQARAGGTPTLLLSAGDPAPGLSGWTFQNLLSSVFALGPNDELAFLAWVQNSAGLTKHAIFAELGGAPLRPIILEGDPAPEAGSDLSFGKLTGYAGNISAGMRFESDGSLSVMTPLWAPGAASDYDWDVNKKVGSLWNFTSTTRRLILRAGQRVPNRADGSLISRSTLYAPFGFPDSVIRNSHGDYLIPISTYIGDAFPPAGTYPTEPNSLPRALVRTVGSSLRLVAREGQQIPDSPGAILDTIGMTGQYLVWQGWRAEFNNRGQVLFPAVVRLPPDASFPTGRTYATQPIRVDENLNLRWALRDGTRLPFDGELLNLIGVSVPFGHALSDSGSVLFSALNFTAAIDHVIGTMTIQANPPVCGADWNGDGSVTVEDLFNFLVAWFSHNVDLTGEGDTTVEDLFQFLQLWFRGC